MIDVSETLKNIIESDSRTFKVRILHGENTYKEIRTLKKSVKFPDSSMSIGNALCSMVECSAEDVPLSIIGAEVNMQIAAVGCDEWIPFGSFKAERPTVQNGTVNFIAYDAMNAAGNKTYISQLSDGKHTVREIFDDICRSLQAQYTALPAELGGLVTENTLSGYSCRDALAYLAGFIGCNCFVNRQGLFEMKAFTAFNYDKLNGDRIAEPNLSDADSIIGYIACCVDGETTLQTGTGSDGFEFISPLMTKTQLNFLGAVIMDETSPVRIYRAGKIKQLLGDPRLDICDVVNLQLNGNSYTVPIMSLKFDFDGGLLTEIESFDLAEPNSLSLNERLSFSAKQASEVATKYSKRALEFSSSIGNAMGLYQTAVAVGSGTIIYSHDKPTLAQSTYICCRTSEGFAVASSWGGTHENTVWQSGFDREGNAVLKMLTAFKIRTDQIEAGSVTADKIKVTDLSALNATIANWVIHPNLLYVPSERQEDGSYSGGVGLSNTSYAFYAGYRSTDENYNDSASHPGSPWERESDGRFDEENVSFYITRSGKMVARNAEISGKLTASNSSGSSKVIIENGGLTCCTTPPNGTLSEYGAIKAAVDESVDLNNPMFCIQSNSENSAGMVLSASKNTWYTMYANPQSNNYFNYRHCFYGNIQIQSNMNVDGQIYSKGNNIIGISTNGYLAVGSRNQGVDTNIYAPSDKAISLNAQNIHLNGTVDVTGGITVVGASEFSSTITSKGKIYAEGGIYSGEINIQRISSSGSLLLGSSAQTSHTQIYAGTGFAVRMMNDLRISPNTGVYFHDGSDWLRGIYYGTVNSLTGLHLGMQGKPLYLWCSEIGSASSLVFNTDIRLANLKGIYFYSSISSAYKKAIEYGSHIIASSGKSYGCLKLGDSNDYMYLYGTGVFLNGATTVTSDARLKKDIEFFTDKHEVLFSLLKPKVFRYTDGTSGRKHFGFIAQEVEDAITSAELTTQEVAAFVALANEDGSETLSLRYDEFVSLNTHMIQKAISKITSIEEEIIRLKETVNHGR